MRWWYYQPQALTPEECAKIIRHGHDLKLSSATVGLGGKTAVHEETRRSVTGFFQRWDQRLMPTFHKLYLMGRRANAEAFGFDLDDFQNPQFTIYEGGPPEAGQYYKKHIDLNWNPAPDKTGPYCRKMSMVVQLSPPETYRGGRLIFEHDPLPEGKFLNQGDAVFFPSFNPHEVTPVTDGVRYSLVAWFEGPWFR